VQDSLTDAELFAAIAQGDRDAFAVLLGRHAASVHRLATAMSGSSAAADDVCQEVFLAAWRSAGSFKGTSSAKGWLFTITRNAVSRSRRRRAGQPLHDEPLDVLATSAGWGCSSSSTDFARALENRELLLRAMARLTTADQEVLTLVDLEGMTLAETAEMVDVELPALKSRLHRARLRLLAAVREISS
jgi:RNA polymerase sigma-70 factor (ECF subfamily)